MGNNMVNLNVNMTQEEFRILSKYLNKIVEALKDSIKEHEQTKIKAEAVIKIHELESKDRCEDDDVIPSFHKLFTKLTGTDPVESAREFLRHYDSSVKEMNDSILVMTLILHHIKDQIIK